MSLCVAPKWLSLCLEEEKDPDYVSCEKNVLCVGYYMEEKGRMYLSQLNVDTQTLCSMSTVNMSEYRLEHPNIGNTIIRLFLHYYIRSKCNLQVLHSRKRMALYFQALTHVWKEPFFYFESGDKRVLHEEELQKELSCWQGKKFFFSSCDMHSTLLVSEGAMQSFPVCLERENVTKYCEGEEWCVLMKGGKKNGMQTIVNGTGDMIFFSSNTCVSISCKEKEGFYYDMMRDSPSRCWDFVLHLLSDGDPNGVNVHMVLPRLLSIMRKMDKRRMACLTETTGFSAVRLFNDDTALTILDTLTEAMDDDRSQMTTTLLKKSLGTLQFHLQKGEMNLSSSVRSLLRKKMAELQEIIKERKETSKREKRDANEREKMEEEEHAKREREKEAEERVKSCLSVVKRCIQDGNLDEATRRLCIAEGKYASLLPSSSELLKELRSISLSVKSIKKEERKKEKEKKEKEGRVEMMHPDCSSVQASPPWPEREKGEETRTQRKKKEEVEDISNSLLSSFSGLSLEEKQQQTKKKKKKETSFGQEKECVICMEKERSHAGTSCGHLILCDTCSKMTVSCPLCMKETKWVKIFL